MRAFIVAIALVGLLSVSSAQSLRSQVETADKAIAAAIKKKDFSKLSMLMRSVTTDDFKYTEAGKSQSYAEMTANMKTGLGMMGKITVCTVRLLTLHQHGSTADGTTRHTMAGIVKTNDKKVHKMSFTGVSANTYRLEGHKWKLVSMKWVSQKQSMDGKPVPSMGG